MEKSVILIDGENVVKNWIKYCEQKRINAKIDYLKLVKRLSLGTNLLRAYFYDGVPDQIPPRKERFMQLLEANGIQLRTKVLKLKKNICPHCQNVEVKEIQKGVDVSLATDVLRHAWQETCDICIIVSGDEDYKDAVDCAKDKGVKVWVASFKHCLSANLRRSADKTIILDDIFEELIYTPDKRNP